jgi:anti-anti-sigma factor
MPLSGLVISQVKGVTVVNFDNASILDGAAVEAIAKELYALVDQQAQRKLVLNFRKVRFLCSSMIGVVIALHKKSTAIKGRMVICGLRSELHKVFQIMKLEKVLAFTQEEDEAVSSLEV